MGLPAVEREGQERFWQQVQRRIYFSTHPLTYRMHDQLRAWRIQAKNRPHPKVLAETTRALEERRPDILLLSAYLDHRPSVVALSSVAAAHGIPVLLGGPVFNVPEIARAWHDIPGLTAIVGAEVDLSLGKLVDCFLGDGDPLAHPGVVLSDGRESPPAPPLHRLDALRVPDFDDFPWHRYKTKVIPVMTGRGCAWGRCVFCSDIATANGRTFRSRPVTAVLDEIEEQTHRYGTRDVIFLDIKLNSDLSMWRGIIDGFQDRVPGGRWIGTVHVNADGENGLTAGELSAAAAAGLTRTTFGLESGSQRVTNMMSKGTRLERTSDFIHDAFDAGISVRTTVMLGYPGESTADVEATTRYISSHQQCLDRVRLSRFKAIPGAPFQELYERAPERYPGVEHLRWNFRYARATYHYGPARDPSYRRAKNRLLSLVHEINRKPLRIGAAAFDGLM